jgi:predicted site-specific integrase-resolvase
MEQLWKGYKRASQGSGIPERTLRTMTKNGVIPYIRAGHRTILFSPSKIEKALQRRTVRAVG